MAREIQPASQSAVAVEPDLQDLVEKCRAIGESLRTSVIEHYWRLGEAISKAFPKENREAWGSRVVMVIERVLDIDRSTIWRAIQCYETFPISNLLTSGRLTWGKLRLLLPISPERQAEILARIESGELRTTDDVRDAIRALEQGSGKRPTPLLRPGQMELFGVPGLTLERFTRGWGKAEPRQRSAAVRAVLIPNLGLEDLARPAALDELRGLRDALDTYERRLSQGDVQ